MWHKPAPPRILTPCIGVCGLDAQGYCEGCFRTIEEITGWASLDDAERARMMNQVLPAREAALRR